jgi:hypothetical protein
VSSRPQTPSKKPSNNTTTDKQEKTGKHHPEDTIGHPRLSVNTSKSQATASNKGKTTGKYNPDKAPPAVKFVEEVQSTVLTKAQQEAQQEASTLSPSYHQSTLQKRNRSSLLLAP